MTPGKSVIGKLCHQREYLFRFIFLNPSFHRPINELLFMQRHFLALLFPHRPAHQIGFTECIAGQLLGKLHDLFLVHKHSKGVA